MNIIHVIQVTLRLRMYLMFATPERAKITEFEWKNSPFALKCISLNSFVGTNSVENLDVVMP